MRKVYSWLIFIALLVGLNNTGRALWYSYYMRYEKLATVRK